MATRKITRVLIAVLALTVLSSAALLAAPLDPGRLQLHNRPFAPIIRGGSNLPHSDGWNEQVLDRDGATELRVHAPIEKPELIRGGLAENYQRPHNAPVIRKPASAPHSDEWNARVFDRNERTQLPYHVYESRPDKLRGGPVEWQTP